MPRGGWRLLSLRHSGFNVHSLVRTETKSEAERVGKDMIRPVVSLERLEFIEPEGRVGYRIGREDGEQESMDYPEFIARVTSHIPDKGQVMVRYYGLYSNAYRGKVKKAGAPMLRIVEPLPEGVRDLRVLRHGHDGGRHRVQHEAFGLRKADHGPRVVRVLPGRAHDVHPPVGACRALEGSGGPSTRPGAIQGRAGRLQARTILIGG